MILHRNMKMLRKTIIEKEQTKIRNRVAQQLETTLYVSKIPDL